MAEVFPLENAQPQLIIRVYIQLIYMLFLNLYLWLIKFSHSSRLCWFSFIKQFGILWVFVIFSWTLLNIPPQKELFAFSTLANSFNFEWAFFISLQSFDELLRIGPVFLQSFIYAVGSYPCVNDIFTLYDIDSSWI